MDPVSHLLLARMVAAARAPRELPRGVVAATVLGGLAPDIDATLRYVTDAVRQIRRALTDAQGRQRVPLIGFSGSPWTLACYMVEGGGSDDFRLIKSMLYGRPDLLHAILRVNARAVADYLNAQIEAGAQAVMIFDTWGGTLADGAYQAFSLAYMRDVVRELENRVRFPEMFAVALASCALLEKAMSEGHDFMADPMVYMSHRISVDRPTARGLRSNDVLHMLVEGPHALAAESALGKSAVAKVGFHCFGLVADGRVLYRAEVDMAPLAAIVAARRAG